MEHTTIVFFIRQNKICLALKKHGFGEGKLNGYGGKFKKGELLGQALQREVKEESSTVVQPEDCEQVASIEFHFGTEPAYRSEVFVVYQWQGELQETEEMGRPQWYNLDQIPYDQMFKSDQVWLPRVLAGEKFIAKIYYDSESQNEITHSEFLPTEFNEHNGPDGISKFK